MYAFSALFRAPYRPLARIRTSKRSRTNAVRFQCRPQIAWTLLISQTLAIPWRPNVSVRINLTNHEPPNPFRMLVAIAHVARPGTAVVAGLPLYTVVVRGSRKTVGRAWIALRGDDQQERDPRRTTTVPSFPIRWRTRVLNEPIRHVSVAKLSHALCNPAAADHVSYRTGARETVNAVLGPFKVATGRARHSIFAYYETSSVRRCVRAFPTVKQFALALLLDPPPADRISDRRWGKGTRPSESQRGAGLFRGSPRDRALSARSCVAMQVQSHTRPARSFLVHGERVSPAIRSSSVASFRPARCSRTIRPNLPNLRCTGTVPRNEEAGAKRLLSGYPTDERRSLNILTPARFPFSTSFPALDAVGYFRAHPIPPCSPRKISALCWW